MPPRARCSACLRIPISEPNTPTALRSAGHRKRACWTGRAALHVGIRGSLYTAGDLTDDADLGFQVVAAPELDQIGIGGLIERIGDRVAG
jgi:hypothetical protein